MYKRTFNVRRNETVQLHYYLTLKMANAVIQFLGRVVISLIMFIYSLMAVVWWL